MLSNFSNRTDRAELYCMVHLYNHLTNNNHMAIIRLPHDYMTIQDIERYIKKQVETIFISCIKIIGVGASILGERDSTA